MDNADHLDWTLLRAVLAVAEAGSLSAAARDLGLSQPTLGRHIAAAEEALGRPLFRRHVRGLEPTDFCASILPMAADMRDSVRRLSLLAAGEDQAATGRVRVTASVIVATQLLPPILADLRLAHPGITLDVVASDRTENLLFHEADIAVRMYRPTQLEMVTRHLGQLELGLFATPGYLARKGWPERAEDLLDHAFLGYDRDDRLIMGMRALGYDVARDWFVMRTDDPMTYWQLVLAGCGIGVGQVAGGGTDPRVVRVCPELAIPSLPVWLTAHERLRRTPRVSAVWDALATGLGRLLS